MNHFSNLSIPNQFIWMNSVVNYLLSLFEGSINPGDLEGIKLYVQSTQEIYKEYDKLNISVSNYEDIIIHFLGLAKNMSGNTLNSW